MSWLEASPNPEFSEANDRAGACRRLDTALDSFLPVVQFTLGFTLPSGANQPSNIYTSEHVPDYDLFIHMHRRKLGRQATSRRKTYSVVHDAVASALTYMLDPNLVTTKSSRPSQRIYRSATTHGGFEPCDEYQPKVGMSGCSRAQHTRCLACHMTAGL